MAKMQIPLNGSNYISKNRAESFQNALDDDHQVQGTAGPQLTVSPQEPAAQDHYQPASQRLPEKTSDTLPPSKENSVGDFPILDLALNHTYDHQQRTLDIHQQYISQQAEYIQLITAVLEQQGKALNEQDGQTASNMIETFQRTLDNFHSLREQGVEIHRDFLNQQTAFLEKYLDAIENGKGAPQVPALTPAPPPAKVTEWVVQQPPIVLDEHTEEGAESSPRSDLAEVPGEENSVQDGNLSVIAVDDLSAGLLEIVAEKTGYPAEMLELDMDLEADLGIDSIKRVEILGSLEERFPELPPADMEVLSQTRTLQEIIDYMGSAVDTQAPPSQSDPTLREVKDPAQSPPIQVDVSPDPMPPQAAAPPDLTPILLEIVAEKTGYPAEMLELDMDMEADLGIDSIKRVEILGSMEERVPGLPPVPTETLAELRTLEQIVNLMAGAGQASPDNSPEEKKKADRIGLDNTPVNLISLPRPDRLDFTIPEDRPLILTDEGSELTQQISSALEEQGWKTILWEFPDHLSKNGPSKGNGSIPRIKQSQSGADAIKKTLTSLRAEYGIPAGYIHLHPQAENDQLFSEREEGLLKEVFFIASALQEDLTQVDPTSRNLFLTITRLDGTLGLQDQEHFQVGAGLPGLVKSLSWEWPDVFCRAIDFHRDMNQSEISQRILEEIHDPNKSILEVGISPDNRVSLTRDHGDQ